MAEAGRDGGRRGGGGQKQGRQLPQTLVKNKINVPLQIDLFWKLLRLYIDNVLSLGVSGQFALESGIYYD